MCKGCKRPYQQDWYRRNAESHKKNVVRDNQRRRLHLHEQVMGYLRDHPCVDCGETDLMVLTFDHVRDQKSFDIGTAVGRLFNWNVIRAEIEKCDVRCANCHMRATSSRGGWYRSRVGRIV